MSQVSSITRLISQNGPIDSDKYTQVFIAYLRALLAKPFRWYESLSAAEQVARTPLPQAPIFLLGHWRSGTTFFYRLLSQDDRLGYLNYFEAMNPDIFLSSEKVLKPGVNQLLHRLGTRNAIHRQAADLELPGELDVAHLIQHFSHNPHLGHLFPRHADYYFDKYLFFDTISPQELSFWRKSYAHLLRKMVARHGQDRPLVIKSPVNTARVDELQRMFPQAKFIYLHRNPQDVFYSNLNLWRVVLDRFALQRIPESQVRSIIFRVYRRMMDKYLNDRQLVASENLVELSYDAVQQDPMGQLEQVYAALELPEFENVREKMEAFLAANQRLRTAYDYHADDLALIEQHWTRPLAPRLEHLAWA